MHLHSCLWWWKLQGGGETRIITPRITIIPKWWIKFEIFGNGRFYYSRNLKVFFNIKGIRYSSTVYIRCFRDYITKRIASSIFDLIHWKILKKPYFTWKVSEFKNLRPPLLAETVVFITDSKRKLASSKGEIFLIRIWGEEQKIYVETTANL